MTRAERALAALVAVTTLITVLAYVGPSVSVGGLHFGRAVRAPRLATTEPGGAAGDTAAPGDADAQPVTVAAGAVTPDAVSTAASAAVTKDAPTTVPVPTSAAPSPPAATTTSAPGPRPRRSRTAGWVAEENARAGTDAWRIVKPVEVGWIEGYLRTTSARPGDALPLYVDTGSPEFRVEAYRMGFYGGRKARLVWTSAPMPAVRQPAPVVDAATGLAEARWSPSLVVPVGDDWPPGSYLLKLVSSAAGASYVPLTVRDDDAVAQVAVMNAVTTWQSYNAWGGCSLYACPGQKGRARAVKVSFDRPYARQWNDGSADFLDHELPLVSLVEELGIDAAYVTSIDVHDTPGLLRRYRAALSLGHDEYYTRAMRQALVDARDNGVNLAFLGANAVYRHIRLEASADGRAARTMVNYRAQTDPVAATDPTEVTTEWRKQQAPEASLVGIQYLCANVSADFVVASSRHWVWSGAGVRDGQVLPGLVGNEADGVARPWSPANLEVLGSSPVKCPGSTGMSRASASYYSTPSGAGVFATGTIWWVCGLEATFCSSAANVAAVRAATANVLRAFAAGPAGVAYPSTATSRA